MNSILFPTDFSPTAANAFAYAVALAEVIDARIDLVSIYSLPLNDVGLGAPEQVEHLFQEKRMEIHQRLEAFVGATPRHHIGQLRAEFGIFVASEITDLARREAYHWILMGTKGEHNPMEKALGSVTTQVMMHAPCPVIAIPEYASFQPVKTIAYATDFKPTDEHAVRSLMVFADQLGASVHFVHVDTRAEIGVAPGQIELQEYPFEFTDFTIVNHPSVMEGIDQFIDQRSIDIVAMFIPRRRLWERLFHSSFTRRMTFHAKIPLLVFHQ